MMENLVIQILELDAILLINIFAQQAIKFTHNLSRIALLKMDRHAYKIKDKSVTLQAIKILIGAILRTLHKVVQLKMEYHASKF